MHRNISLMPCIGRYGGHEQPVLSAHLNKKKGKKKTAHQSGAQCFNGTYFCIQVLGEQIFKLSSARRAVPNLKKVTMILVLPPHMILPPHIWPFRELELNVAPDV